MSSAGSVSRSLDRLGNRLVRTARCFRDYNFRHYFIRKAREDIQAMRTREPREQLAFLRTEGRAKLREMQRMVLLNRMFAQSDVCMGKPSLVRSTTVVGSSDQSTGSESKK